MTVDTYGTHVSHCCFTHGCKYGDGKDCPVETGEAQQGGRCEQCYYDATVVVLDANQSPPQVLKVFTGYWALKEAEKFADMHRTASVPSLTEDNDPDPGFNSMYGPGYWAANRDLRQSNLRRQHAEQIMVCPNEVRDKPGHRHFLVEDTDDRM